MNIAFLSIGFSKERKEATAITLINLAKEFIRRGHKVVIISRKNHHRERLLQEYEKIDNIPVYRMRGIEILAHAKGVKYVQTNLKIKFDVIHNFSNAPVLALRAIMAKKYAKKAMIIQTIKAQSEDILGSLFFSRILNNMDKVTVPTEVLAGKLIKNGCKKEKISIIRSHIDKKKFFPKNKERLKKKYGYGKKKIVFYYGAIRKKGKGIKYLIDAIPKVILKNPNVLFVFAPRNDTYEKDFGRINGEKIRIVQNINIDDYVNMADVVALPYENMVSTEGNPSCLLESMACKTAVVTTDLPEIREIVSDRKEVLMAKPRNSKDLAEKINLILKNKSLREKLIKNAYKKSGEFDSVKIAGKFLKLYKNG